MEFKDGHVIVVNKNEEEEGEIIDNDIGTEQRVAKLDSED